MICTLVCLCCLVTPLIYWVFPVGVITGLATVPLLIIALVKGGSLSIAFNIISLLGALVAIGVLLSISLQSLAYSH